jgi:hypothetical protein
MKNITIKGFIAVVACTAIISCGKGKDEKPKEKYCGVELSGFEVIDLKAVIDKGFTATDEDNKLMKDIVNDINDLFGDKYEIGMSIFMKDKDAVGMYFVGPDDAAVVEKISCHILGKDYEGRLPKNKKLLFYTNDHNTIVAAVKTK